MMVMMLKMLHVLFLLLLILEWIVVRFKDDVSLVCAAGAGMYSKHSSNVWARRSCGHLDDVGTQECRLFCAVPGPLLTGTKSRNLECCSCLASTYFCSYRW